MPNTPDMRVSVIQCAILARGSFGSFPGVLGKFKEADADADPDADAIGADDALVATAADVAGSLDAPGAGDSLGLQPMASIPRHSIHRVGALDMTYENSRARAS